MIVYLNGAFLPLEDAKVSVLDRGFIYGDGVYELIPVYRRQPFRLPHHLARLKRSLDGIRKTFRPALQAIEQRGEGALRVCLATAELEALQASALAGAVLEHEPRLSNAGLPADLHQDRAPRRSARLCVDQPDELVPATHEGC